MLAGVKAQLDTADGKGVAQVRETESVLEKLLRVVRVQLSVAEPPVVIATEVLVQAIVKVTQLLEQPPPQLP